jgi:hypothetical protein
MDGMDWQHGGCYGRSDWILLLEGGVGGNSSRDKEEESTSTITRTTTATSRTMRKVAH